MQFSKIHSYDQCKFAKGFKDPSSQKVEMFL